MSAKEWYKYKLSDLVHIIGGGTPKTSTPEYWGGSIPWLSVKDFAGDNRYVNYTEKTITEDGLRNSSTKLLNKGDLIISARGTVGEIAQLGKDMAFNQSCYGLRANQHITNDFLYYLLKYVVKYLKNNAHGSVFDTITKNTFANVDVTIPDLEEQKAIERILSSLDGKIEANNQINKKLEEMAQAMFKQWFVNFEFPNDDGKPYKSSGGDMIESELGMIPKGWRVGNLGEIVGLSTKSVNPQKYPERRFEHFSIPALDNNKVPEMQLGEEIKSNKYIISDNAVLISKLNPTTKRIWRPVPQGEYPVCSTEFMVYIPKEKNVKPYIYELINSNAFSEMLVSHATGSTGSRQRVKPSQTLDFKCSLPPFELMSKFSDAIKALHDNVSYNIIENEKLSLIRDTLLPKLMSGEVRVPSE
ncbi:restriction endonuclease subunit S [Bacillus cereus group sp. MYBK220-1]|uniref:restriction endonuclease subunit S n=1 Tax=Bacillus cereus group sp. MYBK220-1 TaxID=3450660 RepID=UPI003F7A86BE